MSDEINFLIHSNAANAFRQGRVTEQNRIIKLLEPHAQHDDYCKDGCYSDGCLAFAYQYAIGLIKREQK